MDDEESESETDSHQVGQWVSCSNIDLVHLPFTVSNPGVQLAGVNIPDNILEFFELFFTSSVWDNIVAETNHYAKEKLEGLQLARRSIWDKWSDITVVELRAYLGVILRIAMQDRGDIKTLFSTQWIDYTPFYGNVFSRERFFQIHWMLHVQPSTVTTGRETRGSKISNLVTHMKSKCLELFIPYQDVVIDESTISFKGRAGFKMYNPQKPHKWGLRVFALADCKIGYLCAFEPYYGSATTNSLHRPELPFTSRIVVHLCTELLQRVNGHGFHLFTNRYYTGHDLAMELLKQNIHTTGTVMRNRKGLPPDVKRNLKLKKHDVSAWSWEEKEVVSAWQDKRVIYMLSTYYGPSSETQHRMNKKREEEVVKPTAIVEYTKHMGAVDRFDHYCSSYAFTRKSLKWWRKTFFWFVEVAVINGFILYKECYPDEATDHIRYRKQLIVQLVGEQRAAHPARRRGRPSTLDKEERLDRRKHFIAAFQGKKTKDLTVWFAVTEKPKVVVVKLFTFVKHVHVSLDYSLVTASKSFTLRQFSDIALRCDLFCNVVC